MLLRGRPFNSWGGGGGVGDFWSASFFFLATWWAGYFFPPICSAGYFFSPRFSAGVFFLQKVSCLNHLYTIFCISLLMKNSSINYFNYYYFSINYYNKDVSRLKI